MKKKNPDFYEQWSEDFQTLVEDHPPIILQIPALDAHCVASAIQLACRHPHFTGPTRQIAERVARQIFNAIATTPALAALAEKGWDPDYDVEVEGG